MKSLLVCTDFSASATHAAKYACMLAREHAFSRVILFNAYQTFIPTLTVPVPAQQTDEIQKTAVEELGKLQNELSPVAGATVTIDISALDASLPESVNDICRRERCDMVVMGIKGKSNLETAVTGSNTMNVVENSHYPVLAVPGNAAIEPVRSILVACDLNKPDETIPADVMGEVLRQFNAPLTVLNVDYKNKHFSPRTPDDLYHVHHIFEKYNPNYTFTENKDVAEGVLEYAEQNNISLIIAMPKNYNFFTAVFHRSTTKKIVYHSSLPVLTLHVV